MLTPFDIVYNKLVEQLRADEFKDKNVIDFSASENNPKKGSIQSADLPEVLLYVSACNGNFTESSSSVKLLPVYKYMLSVGSYSSVNAHKLLFNVLRINADHNTHFGPLQWKSKPFVRNTRLVSVDSGESNAEYNRNIKGWVSIVAIEFEFSLDKTDFLQGLT